MYIFICCGSYKHGRIPSKFGMLVSIGHVIIENENKVKKSWGKFLGEILQYTKNLENFHIPASMKTKQICIWSAL
jgi:hypothetical protein